MVLKNIEDVLERLVEGVFSRAFKSDLQPIELGRRIIKEVDSNRKLDVQGRALAPNAFVVSLSPEDYKQFAKIEDSLKKELIASVRDYCKRENLGFLGPVDIELQKDPQLKVGFSKVFPAYDDSLSEGEDSHCWMEAQGGVYYQLKNKKMTIGRVNECDIVIDDENISRRHAELRPQGDSFELIDLGSTNGCKVNDEKIKRVLLADSDEVKFGPIKLWFRQG